jgi:hypothetical protein
MQGYAIPQGAVRKSTVIFLTLIALAMLFGVSSMLRGHAVFEIADVTNSHEMSVTAPPFLFRRAGNMQIIVEGSLNGTASLLVYSNRHRDVRTLAITNGLTASSDAEAWSDDLTVILQPGTAM